MTPASQDPRRRRTLWLTIIGLLVVLFAAGVFTLGSLNIPITPRTRAELIALFAVSAFIVAAFLVFLVIFGRSLIRAWADRQAGRPGSRFKWKMVMGALAISLLPVVFMFFISYGLWNRTFDKWFPRSLEIAAQESLDLLDQLEQQVPPEERAAVRARRAEIEEQVAAYRAQQQDVRAYKRSILLQLGLFTVVLLFSVTWIALFLSKMVTTPIEALAQATGEIARGNFDHRVEVAGHDELGALVTSFNQMTAQLGSSRRQIDEFTRSLQRAVEEIESRRRMMEAILENIPTGVVSLDSSGGIVRTNRAVSRIFGSEAQSARTLPELLSADAARDVEQLMRRSLRMGVAARELEITLPGRVLHAALTVTSFGPRSANPGFLVVVDDLTDLLRAQRAAAWQEVAQRIAHEIKNPLTPIQLSAERLRRHLERHPTAGDPELARLVGECAALIEREVAALKSLVDEFSQFARFPKARPAPADINAIVTAALDVFAGRLEGIRVRRELAARLPVVKADAELLRRVLVNLIDNAAEAMEGSAARELTVATCHDPEGEAVEIVVADSGPGISPQDKDLLFLPHFSTKQRGTGLGLAIASRVVAEHGGTIRVEDNQPVGARFVIRLPTAEVPAPVRSED